MPGWCGNGPIMVLKSIGVGLDPFGAYCQSGASFGGFLALFGPKFYLSVKSTTLYRPCKGVGVFFFKKIFLKTVPVTQEESQPGQGPRRLS